MDFQHGAPARQVWRRQDYGPIEAARPEQGVVEDIGTGRGCPTKSTPLGMRAPNAANFSGNLRNSTTSWSSCFASSTPATSANVTEGLFAINMRARLLPKDSA